MIGSTDERQETGPPKSAIRRVCGSRFYRHGGRFATAAFPAAVCALVAWTALPVIAQDSRALRKELTSLWKERRYDDLIRVVTPRLSEAPEDASLWIMAAEAGLMMEDHDAAIARFEKGRKLDPAIAPMTINLGFAYLKADRLDDAAAVFREFGGKDVGKGHRDRAAKAAYGLGLVESARGRAAQAKAFFTTADDLDPSDARAPYRRGQIALEEGDAAAAIARFEAAIARDPLHVGAAYGLARAHALANHAEDAARWTARHAKLLETTDAVTVLIRRLRHAERPADARIAIGRRFDEIGATAEARAWYAFALASEPTHEEARRLAASAAETRR